MHILSLGSLNRHLFPQEENDGYVMMNHRDRLQNEQNPHVNNAFVCGFLIIIFAIVVGHMMSGHFEQRIETNWSASVTQSGDQVESNVAIPWQPHPKP
ncbi:MAG: hypothetical protein ACR2QF_15880 [Geminicoccaceae bacterium]